MNDREKLWDKKLKINTLGRDAKKEDAYHYPYEPTPYSVLERLLLSGCLSVADKVLDYGCGKGRVGFYLSHEAGISSKGIDFDERMIQEAMENKRQKKLYQNVEFQCVDAAAYPVEDETVFYFFNPFSVEILRSVLGKIIDSGYKMPREMKLLFYYPSEEYISCLMTHQNLMFADEIDMRDLFPDNDEREKILIFETIDSAFS